MKILLLTSGYPNLWRPHSGIYVKRHVMALEQSCGIEFRVLTTGDSRKGFPHSLIKYLRLIILAIYTGFTGDFELIHAHTLFPTGLIGMIPKIIRNKKLIITVHGGVVHSLHDRSKYFRKLICFALDTSDSIIAVSNYLSEKLIDLCGVDRQKIEVIDMGVDLDKFVPIDKKSARLRLGLEFDKSIILFVGNLRKIKGVSSLIDAVQMIGEEQRNWNIVLYIVGHGEEEASLKNQAKNSGMDDNILFVGNKSPDEVPLWMAAADVLVVPSLVEGLGLVALEAMACGTCVIASAAGGLQEIVGEGVNGALFEPGDSHDMAEKIKSLISNPSRCKKLIEKGFEVAAEHSLEDQVRKVHMVYTKMALR